MTRRETNSGIWKARADAMGIPFRTLAQVHEALAIARANKCEAVTARLMLRHGRLEPAARQWLENEYPQIGERHGQS